MRNFICTLLATVIVSFFYFGQEPQDSTLLMNRVWFSKLPESEIDDFSYYYFSDTKKDGEFWCFYRSGPWAKFTLWNGTFVPNTPNLTTRWYVDRSRLFRTPFKITQGDFGDFQLKLELNDPHNGGKPTAFYGFLEEG